MNRNKLDNAHFYLLWMKPGLECVAEIWACADRKMMVCQTKSLVEKATKLIDSEIHASTNVLNIWIVLDFLGKSKLAISAASRHFFKTHYISHFFKTHSVSWEYFSFIPLNASNEIYSEICDILHI